VHFFNFSPINDTQLY